jgi:methionyl-tRNA synthetase
MENAEERERISRALTEFNVLALRYAGYTAAEIRVFDASQLSEERMQELLHAKMLDALGRWASREVDAGRTKFSKL